MPKLAFSQPLFYSQSLQNIYYSLPQACRLDNPVADTVVMCNGILQNYTVPIAYSVDRFGILEHVGYRLISSDADTEFYNLAVVRFLEREALSLLVADNLDQKLTNNRENGLTLIHNGNTPRREFYRSRNGLPDLLQTVTSMDIRYDDRLSYRVDLNCGQGQTLTFLFAADAELLSDMDKKERDNRLAAQLSRHSAKTRVQFPHVPLCGDGTMQNIRDSLFVCQGRSFIIPQMNDNLYYAKTDDRFELVFNSQNAFETLANVLLASAGRHDYTFRVAHRQYGGVTHGFDMKSSDFFDYFSEDYDRFFGIESIERDILSGTLMLADRSTASIHLAHVSVSLLDLLYGGYIYIQLNSNIPLHNVENLFGRISDRNNVY